MALGRDDGSHGSCEQARFSTARRSLSFLGPNQIQYHSLHCVREGTKQHWPRLLGSKGALRWLSKLCSRGFIVKDSNVAQVAFAFVNWLWTVPTECLLHIASLPLRLAWDRYAIGITMPGCTQLVLVCLVVKPCHRQLRKQGHRSSARLLMDVMRRAAFRMPTTVVHKHAMYG